MSYLSDYQAASADLNRYYGQPILYRDPSYTASVWASLTATMHPERTERRRTNMGWESVQVRDIFLQKEDIEKIRLDGEVSIRVNDQQDEYAIDEIGDEVGSRHRVVLRRVLAGEIGRGQYRG